MLPWACRCASNLSPARSRRRGSTARRATYLQVVEASLPSVARRMADDGDGACRRGLARGRRPARYRTGGAAASSVARRAGEDGRSRADACMSLASRRNPQRMPRRLRTCETERHPHAGRHRQRRSGSPQRIRGMGAGRHRRLSRGESLRGRLVEDVRMLHPYRKAAGNRLARRAAMPAIRMWIHGMPVGRGPACGEAGSGTHTRTWSAPCLSTCVSTGAASKCGAVAMAGARAANAAGTALRAPASG